MPPPIPYSRQSIHSDDIQAVVDVLKSDWLTTGPKVDAFEEAFAAYTGASYAVAMSSGTAALHACMFTAGIQEGDEVILPPITFTATANCVLYQSGTPVFADVRADDLLLDPEDVRRKITPRTKAIIAVDYAGQPCDYDSLRDIARDHNLLLIADACHSLGSSYKSEKTGTLADLTAFSFHPVKMITTGEGGMVTTNNPEYYKKLKLFRNHGITSNFRERQDEQTWYYEMTHLGYNYRITDIQCALGHSQLNRLDTWVRKRNDIAKTYNQALKKIPGIRPLVKHKDRKSSYHLYVISVESPESESDRKHLFLKLRQKEIGVNVHYIPVYQHPYYKNQLGFKEGLCPVAENAYKSILSIPNFPDMTTADTHSVLSALDEALQR